MSKKDKGFFQNIAADVSAETPRRGRAGSGYLADRDDTLANLASGKYETRSLLWVDPGECKIWEHHNRRYDLLSEARCADLIEGMKAIGRQEFPAIVRPVTGDQKHKYEVIAGARRHWTIAWLRANNFPQFRFLIDVRAGLTDEEAFRISDIENRDREDISDYERAVDYKSALAMYYRTQKDMAARLEVSEAWLSRYLALADFPTAVVEAYADIRDIREKHARDLKARLKAKTGRQALVKTAQQIKRTQADRQKAGQPPLDGNAVASLLKSVGKAAPKTSPRKIQPYKNSEGQLLLAGTFDPRSGWTLKIPLIGAKSRGELLEALNVVLDQAK